MILKGSLACIIGVALLYLGYSSASYNIKLMTQGEHIYGELISYDISRSGTEKSYGGVAQFNVAGKRYVTTPERYLKHRPYRIRDIVDVIYLPSDPKQSKLSDDVAIGASTFLPGGVGILAMLFGFGLISGRVQRVDDIEEV